MQPLQKFGRDAMSFNLLYDVPTDWDGDFSMDRLGNVYNSMIIWARWNLVNRVTKLWEKYWINEAKAWELASWFDEFNINSVWEFVEKKDIRWYLEKWYQLVQKANEFITKQEPWVKYKDEATQWEAIECLQNLLYVVKNLAILSAPVLIDWFEKMKNILWFDLMSDLDSTKNWSFEFRKSAFDAQNFNVNLKSEIIYPRID
jgi:methionyl-tRNA synthetase